MQDTENKKAGRPKGGKNKFRTSQEKLELILRYYKSEMGYAKFAKENDVSPSVFYSWLNKYEKDGVNGLKNKKTLSNTHDDSGDKLSELIVLNKKVEELEKQVKQLEKQLS